MMSVVDLHASKRSQENAERSGERSGEGSILNPAPLLETEWKIASKPSAESKLANGDSTIKRMGGVPMRQSIELMVPSNEGSPGDIIHIYMSNIDQTQRGSTVRNKSTRSDGPVKTIWDVYLRHKHIFSVICSDTTCWRRTQKGTVYPTSIFVPGKKIPTSTTKQQTRNERCCLWCMGWSCWYNFCWLRLRLSRCISVYPHLGGHSLWTKVHDFGSFWRREGDYHIRLSDIANVYGPFELIRAYRSANIYVYIWGILCEFMQMRLTRGASSISSTWSGDSCPVEGFLVCWLFRVHVSSMAGPKVRWCGTDVR